MNGKYKVFHWGPGLADTYCGYFKSFRTAVLVAEQLEKRYGGIASIRTSTAYKPF